MIADYTEAIRIDPKKADAYVGRGTAWSEKKDYDKAIPDYSEAIRIDPKNADAYVGRGAAWSEKKDYGKASADFETTVQVDSNNIYGIKGLAWFLATCPDAKFRNGKRSLELATKAVNMSNSKNPYFMGTLASAFAEMRQFEDAVKIQKKQLRFLVIQTKTK